MPKFTRVEEEVSDHAPREASEPDPTTFVYRPNNRLPDPKPKPGYRYGWIRHTFRNEPDATNWIQMMNEGWVPVKADAVPELSGLQDHYANGNAMAKDGYVEHRGNVLCIIPEYKAAAKEKFLEDQSRSRMAAVTRKTREFVPGQVSVNAIVNKRLTM